MLSPESPLPGQSVRTPLVIAEIACAHEGHSDLLFSLIDAVAAAGADVAQLQIFRADRQVAPGHQLRDLLEELELDEDAWATAFDRVREQGLTPYVFAYDPPSLELGEQLGAEAIKLSSADLSNPRMLDRAGSSGLPITLGTGASTFEEIACALERLEAANAETVVLMHGKQNFPTALEDAHLNRIRLLRDAFGLPVGYQDHTDAELPLSRVIDLAAVGLGACVIEKHVTLDRSAKGTDHEAALEPEEFKAFVERVRTLSEAMGPRKVVPLGSGDREYRRFQKKTVVADRRLPVGTILSPDDVALVRKETEPPISPLELECLFGRRVDTELGKYDAIRWTDLAPRETEG